MDTEDTKQFTERTEMVADLISVPSVKSSECSVFKKKNAKNNAKTTEKFGAGR